MVVKMMCEVSDYKIQNVSQQDDALRLCTTKNSNNLVDKMPNGNSKSIAKDNKSSGKELKMTLSNVLGRTRTLRSKNAMFGFSLISTFGAHGLTKYKNC